MPAGTANTAMLCSPVLATLELEVNAQVALPALNPSNTVLTTLLASFNRLGAPPEGLGAHGRSLKKLHLGCNGMHCVAARGRATGGPTR